VTARSKRMHPLSVLHVIAMAGLLVWWSAYFWRHTPARDVIESAARATETRQGLRGRVIERAKAGLGRKTRIAGAAITLALADVAGGVAVLILFAVGTGIYVRRLEIWLQARSSGDGVALAGSGLADKALAANSAAQRSGR
jgi:hypothetical protein